MRRWHVLARGVRAVTAISVGVLVALWLGYRIVQWRQSERDLAQFKALLARAKQLPATDPERIRLMKEAFALGRGRL